MSTIRVGDNENLENALRRFKRKCSRDGIIGDLRKKEFYEKPSVKKRKKAEAARKRSRKGSRRRLHIQLRYREESISRFRNLNRIPFRWWPA